MTSCLQTTTSVMESALKGKNLLLEKQIPSGVDQNKMKVVELLPLKVYPFKGKKSRQQKLCLQNSKQSLTSCIILRIHKLQIVGK